MGWILLSGEDVAELDLNAFHDLEFEFISEYKKETQTLTLKNLMLTREPQCLTPGNDATSADAVFLLEIADKRWALANPSYAQIINAAYNVRNMATNTNMAGSYTWASMAQEIWETMPLLGTWPGLPYSPQGTPTNWQFRGIPALDALCSILDHLSCCIRFKIDGTYDIVINSGDDTSQDALETTYAKRLIYDARFLEVTAPRIPETVRVMFHRWYSHGGSENTISTTGHWQMNSTTYVDIASGESSNGIVHVIWSDQLANTLPDGTLDTGVSAILTAVANELADNYLTTCLQPRMGRRYSTLIPFETGEKCKAVTWKCGMMRTKDEGVWTEIVWHPFSDFSAQEGRFLSSGNQTPDFSPTFPISSALPNFVEATGEIPIGTTVDATHRIWDQSAGAWVDKSAAKFLAVPEETYLGRLVGNASGVPVFAGQGNSWGNIYVTNIYNVENIYVTNIFVENIYVEYIEVNILNVTIINHYGCTDLVNSGISFNFVGKIACEDDGSGNDLLYQYIYSYKQTYDYTGCPITAIDYLGKFPFGCCDLSCTSDPPPWDYCCTDYPDELCGVFYPINDDGGDCNCATSFVVKFDHPGITATYWGGTWVDGSIWTATKYTDWCLNDCCYVFDDPGTAGDQIYIAHSGNPYEGHKPSVSISNGTIAFFQASCLETTIRYANFNTGTTVINGMKITVIPNTALPSDEDSISDENVSICLTLIDGCYVGSVELDGTTCTVEICCVGTATDPLQYEANLVHDSVPYGPFLAVSVQCGLTDFALDFGIINISGRNYRFVCFVDDTGTCCDGDSSSTPVGDCDPDVDHGYGQYGWTWQPGGYWIHEEGDVNECTGGGIPSYPTGDGSGFYDEFGEWIGIHTTTYCCPPE